MKQSEQKTNNGEGVKKAYEQIVSNLHERFDKMWASEKGRKYLKHVIVSFICDGKTHTFPIQEFSSHIKYKDIPKICAFTGFTVSDVTFTMDEITKEHFKSRDKKINKLVYPIPCIGSHKSSVIISQEAFYALESWIDKNMECYEDFKSEMMRLFTKYKDSDTKPVRKRIEQKELFSGFATHSLAENQSLKNLRENLK